MPTRGHIWPRLRRRLAAAINLDLTHSQARYLSALDQEITPGVKWLDLGCGHQIVPTWAASAERINALALRPSLFVGVDVDPAVSGHSQLDCPVFAIGESLPFPDSTFDVATANMVVEHLSEPHRIFAEVRRVLKRDGLLLFHTPNVRFPPIRIASWTPDGLKRRIIWMLERRSEEDVFPTYYRANVEESIEHESARAGLRVQSIEIGSSVGAFEMFGPIGLLELLFLKLLTLGPFRRYNATIIARCRKQS